MPIVTRRRGPALLSLLATPLASPARADVLALADASSSTLAVLLVGLGSILLAIGVVVFAWRQWRRQAREQRELYRRRAHAGDGRSASSTSR